MKFTQSQIEWAMQHDWFYKMSGSTMWVYGEQGIMPWSGSFKQLRDWAGY